MRIPTKKLNRTIQIDVTSRCDLSCANCTRMLAQHRKPDMTPAQFERAVLACRDWVLRENGVLAIFGGNPCVAKDFPEYAGILARHLPEPNRGLWTNNINGHGEVIRRHFGPASRFNFVAHGCAAAAAEMRREVPWAHVYGADKRSRHASVMVAAGDFVEDDTELWRLVDRCTYDIKWSAVVMQEVPDWQTLGGYSCEIAGAHARANGKALGVPVEPGWLDKLEDDFRHQYDYACRRCGGCLNLNGIDDAENADQYSRTNTGLVELTVARSRRLQRVVSLPDRATDPTDYLRLNA
ncbi:MAG TPA: hypothetical protein VGE74_23320 [Gemmata sp.]